MSLIKMMLIRVSLGTDRKSGSAGMPRPNSYAVFCLKKKRALPAADSRGGIGGDALLAVDRLRGHAVGRGPPAQALGASRSRQRGAPHAAVSPGNGTAGCQRQEARDLFFFNDTATTEIYTLSLHDALPI